MKLPAASSGVSNLEQLADSHATSRNHLFLRIRNWQSSIHLHVCSPCSKITITPKLSAPQLLFHPWTMRKHFPSSQTLYHPNQLSNAVLRLTEPKSGYGRYRSNLQKLHLIASRSLNTYREPARPLTSNTARLCLRNKVVEQNIYIYSMHKHSHTQSPASCGI